MIANRRTFIVKPDQFEAAVEWLQTEIAAEKARGPLPGKVRVYMSDIGPFNQVVMESEYESLAVYEQFWAGWFARPENMKANEKFQTLLVPGGSNEIWTLIE